MQPSNKNKFCILELTFVRSHAKFMTCFFNPIGIPTALTADRHIINGIFIFSLFFLIEKSLAVEFVESGPYRRL